MIEEVYTNFLYKMGDDLKYTNIPKIHNKRFLRSFVYFSLLLRFVVTPQFLYKFTPIKITFYNSISYSL